MATVYEAYDPRFKRDVAIKMLPQEMSHDQQFRARFEREAQTVAMLEHPAIVPVYDYGEENGRLYLVMRLMSGGSLADRLNRGPLSAEEANEIVARIASALDAAHARGIIHRDLKPANILFDRWNKPYLSDFGIVKLATETNTALTAAGGIIGTPAYMSPEQIQGEQNLDGRSDIYALGIILFETLTGQTPISAPTPMGIVYKQVNDPPPRLDELNSTVPAGLQQVIEQSLAKNKAQRYPTAQAMSDSLTQALTRPGNMGGTIIEDDPWLQPIPDAKKERKLPIWMWLGGGLLFAICGIISVAALFIFLSDTGSTTPTPIVEEPIIAPEVETATPTEAAVIAGVGTGTATAEPQDTPSRTPSQTPTAEPGETATSTPSPASGPIVQQSELARSTENRPIDLISVGSGPQHIVVIGALHGNEPGTLVLVTQLANHFVGDPSLVTPDTTLHFIPNINPDGLATNSRYTANEIDINRNWDTPNWVTNAPQPDGTTGSGGPTPLSEPETAALHDFFGELQQEAQSIRVIIIHAHFGVEGTGRVQPGYIQSGTPAEPSLSLANALVSSGSYEYSATCCGSYIPTGEISNWLAINDIAAVDMELPSGGRPNEVVENETILQRAIDDLLVLMAG
jgi:serine/threonine-protein kinase